MLIFKKRQFLSWVFLILILGACEAVEEDFMAEKSLQSEVYIAYNGIIQTENGTAASFTVVNDSSASIQYFGYSENAPHYSTEVLTDTGWVYLFWNWCGTGAEWQVLERDASFNFDTGLPYEESTWRIVLNVSATENLYANELRSQAISYTGP